MSAHPPPRTGAETIRQISGATGDYNGDNQVITDNPLKPSTVQVHILLS